MTQLRCKSLRLALLLAATLVASGAGAAAGGGGAAPPKLSGLEARVAQGGKVALAASALTPAELAALRPHYEALKPRVRTNAE